jgi:hypothetical protein
MQKWLNGKLIKLPGLTDEAEARDYLMKLPTRMAEFQKRIVILKNPHIKWVEPASVVLG